jgi:hypothetical protein
MKEQAENSTDLAINLETLLAEVIQQTSQRLTEFSQDQQFLLNLETAFGTDLAGDQVEGLRQSLFNGEFLETIAIEILPSASLRGAFGAYAAASNTIYLSRELLLFSSEQAVSVLLEEVGHAIDAAINPTDSRGDEGAIFASLVEKEALSQEALDRLQQEDDSTTLEIEGEIILVEQATFTVTNSEDSGSGSLRQAILDANSNPGADLITFDSSLSGEIINLTSGQLEITDDLTIEGLGEDELTIDGDGNTPVLQVDDGDATNFIEVTLSGLTVGGSNSGIFNNENLTLSNSTISGNSSLESAGGIINYGTLTLNNSTVSDNFSEYSVGGGIKNNGIATLNNSTVSYNYGGFGGGGINNYGTLTLANSSVSGNSSSSYGGIGGGISNLGTLTLTNSTISSNYAAFGGGISNSGLATFTNSTISSNSAYEYGGIANIYGTVSLNNSTVSGNSSSNNDNGGIYNQASLTLTNSIVANNNGDIINSDQLDTEGINLVEDGTLTGENIINADPNLSPLQDNGGSTLTQVPLEGSPAIDAGDNSQVDQQFDQRGEGFDRIFGEAVDLGAVEVQDGGSAIAPTANDESFSFLGVPNQSPLIFDVLANDISNDGTVLEITDFPTNTDQGGTLALDDQSRVIYTPNPDFTQGVDRFTYTITNESGGTDEATVEVAFISDVSEVEPNDTISNAINTGISPNNQDSFTASGIVGNNPNLIAGLDVDLYALELASGDRVTIDINAESQGSELDSFVRIFNESGSELDFNDDEDQTTLVDSFLTYTATVPGTYYVGVSEYGNSQYNPFTAGSGFEGSTGEYEIEINVTSVQNNDEPNDSIENAIFTGLSSNNPGRFEFTSLVGDNPNLPPASDIDLFELQLDAGDRLTATIDTSEFATSLDSVLFIFDQSANLLAFNDDANGLDSRLEFTADINGSYFVALTGFSGSTGDYNLELVLTENQQTGADEPNDTINSAVDVTEDLSSTGQFSAQGVIGDNNNLSNPAQDVDLYRIALTQGESVALDVDTSESSFLDLILRVFNANGQEIESNDDGTAPGEQFNVDPFLNFTAPTSGVYYIGLSDFINDLYSPFSPESGLGAGATGVYEIEITQETPTPATPVDTETNPNDTLDTATVIEEIGEPIQGNIGNRPDLVTVPGLDVDLYRLSFTAEQTITIDLSSTSFLDPVLRVFNSQGEEIAFDDDSGNSTDARIEITIPETGDYFIGASGFDNANYDVTEDASGAAFASTGTYQLTITEEVSEQIVAGPEEENDSLDNATATGLNPENRGSFKQTNAIGNNISLETVGLDVDLLAVELDGNTRLTVNINTANSDFDSLLRIFNSEGEPVAFNDDAPSFASPSGAGRVGDSFLEFTPTTAGTFYVGVSGLGNEAYDPTAAGSGNPGSIGEYEIEISLSEAIPEETPTNDTLDTAIKAELRNNRFTRSGFIGDNPNVEGDVDLYRVPQLNAGDILTINIEGESLGSDLESFLRLFNSEGEEISLEYEAGDFPDPEITLTVPEQDTYFIGVSAFSNNQYDPTVANSGNAESTGEYEINLSLQAAPAAAPPPIEEIRPTAENDSFRVESNGTGIFNVLGNDTANDDPGFLEIVDFPEITDKGGTIELDDQSRLVYTPDPDFGGVDTFTYTIANESGGIAQGSVEVNVNRPPDGASVQVNLEITAVPGQEDQLDNGVQIGDEFLVDVRFIDQVSDNNESQAVVSGYADLLFDPNVLQVIEDETIDDDVIVDGIIRYPEYPTTRKGTVRNNEGLVDEAGGFSGSIDPPEDNRVFSLHFQAIGGGNTALLASEAGEQGTSAITIIDALADQRNRTNFGEIDIATALNEEVVEALPPALNLANANNVITPQEGGVTAMRGIIEAIEVTVNFQDLNGNPIQEVAVGETFNIVLSGEDLRPEGEQLGVFSIFADVVYDTVLVDVDQASLTAPFASPVLPIEDAIDDGTGMVNAIGGTNSEFTPVTGVQEFAVLTATASAPGTLNISTNAPEAATALNTLFGVDVSLNDGTVYGENSLNISGETPQGNPDLVITKFNAVTDHVLGGETTVNFTVANQGEGSTPGFQVEILYYTADNITELTAEEPQVVKTLALDELAAGAEITETAEIALPIETLLAEALADDPSVFGQQLPEDGTFDSNNIDYVGVRIVNSAASRENQEAFLNNEVTGIEGVDVDDIAYFPWDFLNLQAEGIVQGGEDNLISDGEVTPVDANAVFNNIGQIISETEMGESEIPASLGLDLTRIDLDLDGAISPVDAVRVVNRVGYEINPAIFDDPVG